MSWSYVAKWLPSGPYPGSAPVLTRSGGVGLLPNDVLVLFVQWASPLSANFVAPPGFTRIDSDYGPSLKTEIWTLRADASTGSSPSFTCGFSTPVSWSCLEIHTFRGGTGYVGETTGYRDVSGTILTARGVTAPYAGCALINSYLVRRSAALPPIVGPRTSGIVSHDDDAAPITGMGHDISWAVLTNGGFTNDRLANSGAPIVQAQSTSILLLGPPPPVSFVPQITNGPLITYGGDWTRTGPRNTSWYLHFTADDFYTASAHTLRAQLWTGPNRSGALVSSTNVTSRTAAIITHAYNNPAIVNGNQTLYLSVDSTPNAGAGLVSGDYPVVLKRDDQASGLYGSMSGLVVQANKSWSFNVTIADNLSNDIDELRWEIRTAAGGGGALLAHNRSTSWVPDNYVVDNDPTLVVGTPATRWLRWYDGAANPAEFQFDVLLEATTLGSIVLSYAQDPNVTYETILPFQATRLGPSSTLAYLRANLVASPVQPIKWEVWTGPGRNQGTLIQFGGFGPLSQPGLFGSDLNEAFPVQWYTPWTGYTFPDGDRLVYLVAYNVDTGAQSNALPFTVKVDAIADLAFSSIIATDTGWSLSSTIFDNLSIDDNELHWELRTGSGRTGDLLASGTATANIPFQQDFVGPPTNPSYFIVWDGALNPSQFGILPPAPPVSTPPTVISASVDYGQCQRTGPNNPGWTLRLTAADQEQTSLVWDLRTGPNGTGTSVASGSTTRNVASASLIQYNAPGLVNGDNHLYLRISDGTNFSADTQVIVKRDDSWPPNWFQVAIGDSNGSSYSLNFTAIDDLSLSAGEIKWEWRTAANGGGTLLAGGLASSGVPVVTTISEAEVGTRYLRVFDGACNPAERSFTVEAADPLIPPFTMPPRACGYSLIYDPALVTQQSGGTRGSRVGLCDRVPSGKYVISRTPKSGLAELAQQVKGYGLRGVVIKLSSFDSAPNWKPLLQGKDWQIHQAQLLADQLPGAAALTQLQGAQTLRNNYLVTGGLFELGQEAYDSPSLAARSIAYTRNRLNLDFVMVDFTDPAWKGDFASNKALALLQHVQGQYTRSKHGPSIPTLSYYCPTFAILPPNTTGWEKLLAPDKCFEAFVNGFSGPKTFAAPRVPAGSTALAEAWQWCRPMDEGGTGIGRAELVVDVRNGISPKVTVDAAVTDNGLVVTFPSQRTNWTPRSGLVIYDDLDGMSKYGAVGNNPTGYWEYDGLSPLEGAVVPVYTPDPLPPIVAGRPFGTPPAHVPGTPSSSTLTFDPVVEALRPIVASVFPANLVNKALFAIQHESGGYNIQQYGDGPGTGYFQMESCIYPWGYQAYVPCESFRPLTVGDGLARSLLEQCQAAYALLQYSDAGGVDPNGKTVFYPWGELPGGSYQTAWGSFRSGFPYTLDGSPVTGPTPPIGLPAPGSQPRIYVSTENWKTGHLGDDHFPQWAEVYSPTCPNARGTRPMVGGWLELNGVRPTSSPHGLALPGGQLTLSGSPRPGDDGQLPLFMEVRKSQTNNDLKTQFMLVLPVADPARMPDSFGTAPSGIPINRPIITDIVEAAGAMHSHAPLKSSGRIPKLWNNSDEWCLGAASPATEIPIVRGTPGVRPPPGSGGGGASTIGCPCEPGFSMTMDCAEHQELENLQALDFATPSGSAIYATCNGIISYRDWDSRYGPTPPICSLTDKSTGVVLGYYPCGYGVMINVDCDDGQTVMRYGHLDPGMPTSSAFPAVGDHVTSGQQIAVSGNTGFSTGPHLHYEVRVNGITVCPFDLIPAGCIS